LGAAAAALELAPPAAAAAGGEVALLAPAGATGAAGASGGLEKERKLQDIVAWLVTNSMRSERTQFDQLCAQNLANVWRQNAFTQLMAGHRHFKVRPDEASAYVWEALGEAFISSKLGAVSKAARLDGKVSRWRSSDEDRSCKANPAQPRDKLPRPRGSMARVAWHLWISPL
jgi:hypothetical protein